MSDDDDHDEMHRRWHHEGHRKRWEENRRRHHEQRDEHRRRWAEIYAEKEMWRAQMRDRKVWGPWWLQARMRRRIFWWFGI
ncbi:MAG TPA: hypothetical protein VGO00_19285, partial [Kofleriaceae bacterium]|nr:hypothetical protein [Kofleriaceae bacterium]